MRRPSDGQLARWGAALREVDPSTLSFGSDGSRVRWFMASEGIEMFVWNRTGQPPHNAQLLFARVSVEWNPKDGVRTGSFAGTHGAVGGRFDPYLLQLTAKPDPEVCKAALLLLRASTVLAAVPPEMVAGLERGQASPP